jgi:hypothetical protein
MVTLKDGEQDVISEEKMVNIHKMKNIALIRKDENDPLSLWNLAKEAKEFLCSHKWCKNIQRGFLDIGIAGIVAVFYFEIESTPDADKSLWVITGDLPPAYIVTDDCSNGVSALNGYVSEMREWVKAVKENRLNDLKNLIPVDVPITINYAEMLESRLHFIENRILNH